MDDLNEKTVIDFGDFKITIKSIIGSRLVANRVNLMEAKFARKEAMIDNGQLSKEQELVVRKAKDLDIAYIYADLIIAEWSGVWINKVGDTLYDFNKTACTRENIISFVTNPKFQDMVVDIVDQAKLESNFVKVQEAKEQKNLKKS